jgi:hypothetical protein
VSDYPMPGPDDDRRTYTEDDQGNWHEIPRYTPPGSLADYPARPVSVYTTLRDDPDRTQSAHIGVFSSEKLARDAAQEDQAEDDEETGDPPLTLDWRDDSAGGSDGSVYTVILTTLDVRTGMG